MIDHEALKTGTVVSQLTNAIQVQVDYVFPDGVVVPTGEVVGSILFTGDQLFRVGQLTAGAGTDLNFFKENLSFFITIGIHRFF